MSDRAAPLAPKRSFAPVVDSNTGVLILGSLPGEASLKAGQYYANPRNQFWRLLEPVVGIPLTALSYPARLAALLSAGVGLWDVILSAERRGSLDADIRDHRPNALGDLVASLPALTAVAFNGGTASTLGRRILGDRFAPVLLSLPSSSPAYTASFAGKQATWGELGRFLRG